MTTIRRATEHDSASILRLTRDFATSFETDEPTWCTSFDQILQKPEAVLLVAEEGGVIIGYLLGFDHPTLHANGPTAWVDELAVDPASQRTGAGRALMRAFEDWSRERGCVLVGLATRRAAAFYNAIGYEESAAYFRKVF
ncbi:MAG: GNAT family N-acetyltransferase [Chloroflexota bacterium]